MLDRMSEARRQHISSVRIVTRNFVSVVCSWREPFERRSANESSIDGLAFRDKLLNAKGVEVVVYDDGYCVPTADRTTERRFDEDLVRGFKEDSNCRAWLGRHLRTREPDVEIVFIRRHHV
jgi:hypothetical protein